MLRFHPPLTCAASLLLLEILGIQRHENVALQWQECRGQRLDVGGGHGFAPALYGLQIDKVGQIDILFRGVTPTLSTAA